MIAAIIILIYLSQSGALQDITAYEAAREAELTEFVEAVDAAGLRGVLNGGGPITVFVPRNEALAALPAKTRRNRAQLRKILRHHIVRGSVPVRDGINDVRTARTLDGTRVTIRAANGGTFDGVRVLKSDLKVKNGLLTIVGAVAIPD